MFPARSSSGIPKLEFSTAKIFPATYDTVTYLLSKLNTELNTELIIEITILDKPRSTK